MCLKNILLKCLLRKVDLLLLLFGFIIFEVNEIKWIIFYIDEVFFECGYE